MLSLKMTKIIVKMPTVFVRRRETHGAEKQTEGLSGRAGSESAGVWKTGWRFPPDHQSDRTGRLLPVRNPGAEIAGVLNVCVEDVFYLGGKEDEETKHF